MSSLPKNFEPALANFLQKIGEKFQPKIDQLLLQRQVKKDILDRIESVQDLIDYLIGETPTIDKNESVWNIGKLPKRLEKRYIDTGDVSPSCLEHLEKCLNTSPDLLKGIQVRFLNHKSGIASKIAPIIFLLILQLSMFEAYNL